jgi:hypothetical protein
MLTYADRQKIRRELDKQARARAREVRGNYIAHDRAMRIVEKQIEEKRAA